jgi:hypothetical protein
METRNISLTLEKAKEWYNSGSADLKEVALQAYSEQELKTEDWERIKTFEDACDALGIDSSFGLNGAVTKYGFRKHLTALYKLDIIRQALNKDYKPSLVHGTVYYPWIRFYKSYKEVKNVVRDNDWKLCGKVKIEGTTYFLVCCGCNDCSPGLSCFSHSVGAGGVTILGLLCCKSREIAQHMGKYFAKEIFDATYVQHNNYNWV